MSPTERILGIDLGTTNSVVAYFEQGQTIVIQNAEGSKTTPSVVYYKTADEVIVGELAKRHLLTHPKHALRSVKRFMGVRYSEIGEKRAGISYDLVEGPNDTVRIDVGWMLVSPEEVSAEILKKMRSTAEEYFSEPVSKAVVTVPAYFNDHQRSATKRAGELAGLEIVRIINEPTAAALAYGIERRPEQKIVVFDFGGGTFDVSVLDLDRDVFEVKSTHGDTYLGGDNIDDLLFHDIARGFLAETDIDLRDDPQALQRLREAVERAKCELSSTTQSLISLPFVAAKEGTPLHLQQSIDRNFLNEKIAPLVPRLIDCCKRAIDDANLKRHEIANVLLVGGSTRIPAVQMAVKEFFGKEANKSLHPDEAVAIGAAIQGSIMSGGLREILLLDVTPLSLGVELAGGVFGVLIPRNSSIPTSANKTFTTVRDNQTVVKVQVLQGERKMSSENYSLGHFRLSGIAPAPKEIPAINVLFQIDANGMLQVSATDATSGASNSLVIEGYPVNAPGEIEEAVRSAEAAFEEDRAFMRLAYVHNQIEHIGRELDELSEDDPDFAESPLAKAVRDLIFKFDLAAACQDSESMENVYSQLKELAADLSGMLLMHRNRRKR